MSTQWENIFSVAGGCHYIWIALNITTEEQCYVHVQGQNVHNLQHFQCDDASNSVHFYTAQHYYCTEWTML